MQLSALSGEVRCHNKPCLLHLEGDKRGSEAEVCLFYSKLKKTALFIYK